MKQLSDMQVRIMQAGAIGMLIGAAAFIIRPVWATLLFAVGALLFCPLQLMQQYEGKSFVVRRLRRQQMLGATALMLTAVMMSMQAFGAPWCRRNEWVVCLAVACVLELYTAFRIPAALRREGELNA